ncbi:hypothetical protein DFS33DRAFT_1388936 [Desarmillaria ectypa]|nr:hypothetical protein DFS33DRAFT_1388936 [Desarmillaria ectypa]
MFWERNAKTLTFTSDNVTDAFVYNPNVDTQTRFKDDSPDEWVVQTETSSAYLERLADCAAQTLNTQHGQYLFPFSLGPGGVRFFKWERSYTVVSCAFNLSTEGRYLVGFSYRFSTLTDSGQGIDETAKPAAMEKPHEGAFTICKILHRNVSGGNILIVYDDKAPKDNHDGGGRGLLNDWDMAIHTDGLDKAAPQAKPTLSVHLLLEFLSFLINAKGTWQFTSIGLGDGTKKHRLQDDFESFIYVMLRRLLRRMVGDLWTTIFDLTVGLSPVASRPSADGANT